MGDPKLLPTVGGPGPWSLENNVFHVMPALWFVGGSGTSLCMTMANATVRRNSRVLPLSWLMSEIPGGGYENYVGIAADGQVLWNNWHWFREGWGAPRPGSLLVDRDTGMARPISAVSNPGAAGGVWQSWCATWPTKPTTTDIRVFFQFVGTDPETTPLLYNSGTEAAMPTATTWYQGDHARVGFSAPLPDAVVNALAAGEAIYFYLNNTWLQGTTIWNTQHDATWSTRDENPYNNPPYTHYFTDAYNSGWGFQFARPSQAQAGRQRILSIDSNRLACTLAGSYFESKTFPYSVVRSDGLYRDMWWHSKGTYENKCGERFLLEGNLWEFSSDRIYNNNQQVEWAGGDLPFAKAQGQHIVRHNKMTLLNSTWAVNPFHTSEVYNAAGIGGCSVWDLRDRFGVPNQASVMAYGGVTTEYVYNARIVKRVLSDHECLLLPRDPATAVSAVETSIGEIWGHATASTPWTTIKNYVERYNIMHRSSAPILHGTSSYALNVRPGGYFSWHDNVEVRAWDCNGAGGTVGLHFDQGDAQSSPAWGYGPNGSPNYDMVPCRKDNSLIRYEHNTIVRTFNSCGAVLFMESWPPPFTANPKAHAIRINDNVVHLGDFNYRQNVTGGETGGWGDPRTAWGSDVVPSRNVLAGAALPATMLSEFFPVYPDNAGVTTPAAIGFADYAGAAGLDLSNYVLADVANTGLVNLAADGKSASFVSGTLPANVVAGQFFRTSTNTTLRRIEFAGPLYGLSLAELWATTESGTITGTYTWVLQDAGAWSVPVAGWALRLSGAQALGAHTWARCTQDLSTADHEVSVTARGDTYNWPPYASWQVCTRLGAVTAGQAASYYFFGTTSREDQTLRMGLVVNGTVVASKAVGASLSHAATLLTLRSTGSTHEAFINGAPAPDGVWTNAQYAGGTFGGMAADSASLAYWCGFTDWAARGQAAGVGVTWPTQDAHPEAPASNKAFAIGFRNSATDGTDPGANIAVVQAMTTGLVANIVTAPSVAITSPTGSPVYFTSSATISLAGTAFDAVGVTGMIWSNDRGGGGTIGVNLTNWSIANIALQSGQNVLTVTASNAAELTGSDVLTVTYTATTSATLRTKFRASSKVTV